MENSQDIFEVIRKERGAIANIHRVFDQFPEGVSAHYYFYRQIMLADNLPLNREDREFLAVKTSEANKCPYCINHHSAAFKKVDTKNLKIEKQRSLESLAHLLTKEPWKASLEKRSFISSGYSEMQWQHAVMVVSYFNLANRCAHAMNLQLEDNFEESCR